MEMTPEEKLRAAGATVQTFTPHIIPGGLTDDPSGGRPWPAPTAIVSALPHVLRLRRDMLPDALAGYIFDIADRQQSPADFSAVAALCAVAAIVGNRVRIAPKLNDDWTVVPNLWGAVIGRPSAMKSPAIQSALGPLYALEEDMRSTWQAEEHEKRTDAILAGLDAKSAKKQAEKAMKDGDRETARKLIAALDGGGDEATSCPRIVVNDATVEKLGELLNENPRGLLLFRDELPGFLARMESEEYQSERAFYLEAFNGDGRFTYDRIGRGTTHIANCTLSIIGGVQPSRIAPIVRKALTGANNDGLVQRLQLAVWPDDKADWKWVDRHPNGGAREAYVKVFHDLHEDLPGSPTEPAVLRFSSEAQEAFRDWMTAVHKEARAGSLSSVMESHLLKMPKTVAALALLFELIDGGRFEVGLGSVRKALLWAGYLRSHAARFYAAGETMAEDGARMIIARRDRLPPRFTARDIHRRDWAGLTDRDAVADALGLLLETHHCRQVEQQPDPAGGRPSEVHCWNPALEAAQ